jgi:anti-sigma B factor antagonist
MAVAPAGFSLRARAEGDRHTLALAGELDLATGPELERRAEQLCAEGRQLILDLSELAFIDSSGLLAILKTRELCAGRRCGFFLTPGPPAVQRLFELTGLLDRLPFLDAPG